MDEERRVLVLFTISNPADLAFAVKMNCNGGSAGVGYDRFSDGVEGVGAGYVLEK